MMMIIMMIMNRLQRVGYEWVIKSFLIMQLYKNYRPVLR
jgi:hypothetical protein